MTRNLCFMVALAGWIAAAPIGVVYYINRNAPAADALTAFMMFFIFMVAFAVAWYLTEHVPFCSDARDTLCSWGSGKADLTTICYMVALPVFLLVQVGSLAHAAQEMKAAQAEAPARAALERGEKIRSLQDHLGMGEAEAAALHDEFDGDEVRAAMEWRKRQTSAAVDAAESAAADTAAPGSKECHACKRLVRADKELCTYCGERLVAKVKCQKCQHDCPSSATRCQYCGSPIAVAAR